MSQEFAYMQASALLIALPQQISSLSNLEPKRISDSVSFHYNHFLAGIGFQYRGCWRTQPKLAGVDVSSMASRHPWNLNGSNSNILQETHVELYDLHAFLEFSFEFYKDMTVATLVCSCALEVMMSWDHGCLGGSRLEQRFATCNSSQFGP